MILLYVIRTFKMPKVVAGDAFRIQISLNISHLQNSTLTLVVTTFVTNLAFLTLSNIINTSITLTHINSTVCLFLTKSLIMGYRKTEMTLFSIQRTFKFNMSELTAFKTFYWHFSLFQTF